MIHWRKFAIAAAAFAAMGLADAAVQRSMAAPVVFNFTGAVDFVDPALAGTFALGDPFALSYTFESTTAATGGSNSTTAVFNALTALSFTVGSYAASSGAAAEIQTGTRDGFAELTDRYAVVSRASDGLTGPAVGGAALDGFILRLDDSTGTVFSDALVLPTAIDLADFDGDFFLLLFRQTSGAIVTVSGRLDRDVPAPGTVALFAGATLVAGGWSRRRRR